MESKPAVHTATDVTHNTPTPGKLEMGVFCSRRYGVRFAGTLCVRDKDETFLVLLPPNDPNGEANARLIVRSVNAHQPLVDALRGLMDAAADVQMTFDQSDPSENHEQPCCCKFCALNKSFAAAERAMALAENTGP